MERIHLSVANVTGGLAQAAERKGLSLAIGFFDGVHLGHQEVIRRAVASAREQDLVSAVMTFDPHPRVVLGHGSQYDGVLTPLEDKLGLFAELGVDAAYVIRFDREFSEVTAERFVQSLIVPLGVRTVTVGFDFSFGHRGQGNAEALKEFGGGGLQVQVVSPVFLDDSKVSSTRIRQRLEQGECAEVKRLTGRSYLLKGTVIHGDARGRQLGYPTANLRLDQPYVIPRTGVYAVEIDVLSEAGTAESRHSGVLNIGHRPTFDAPGGALKLEAHLFDFDGDLYGRRLAMRFHSFLRAEKKFESIDQLVEQIASDSARAREIFSVKARD
ncbi:bifunctional riboflavin kinase/FAD synthetase [Cohnella hongkongensis]|uniref:Riboflavin biosynthesis protein n=1 Tax=Cohnella hongkongensis TaxID=178337 RepID=A0ABV9FFL7_9BACL